MALIRPIAEDNPCGEPLPRGEINRLTNMVEGEPARSSGGVERPEVPPDWTGARELALKLLAQSKDLEVTTLLAITLLQVEGLPGFSNALCLLWKFVESHWDCVHPRSKNPQDATLRVNLINNLASVRGKCIRMFDDVSLYSTPRGTAYSLASLTEGQADQIQAAKAQLKAADQRLLQVQLDAAKNSIAALNKISNFLENLVEKDPKPDFHNLTAKLERIVKELTPFAFVDLPPKPDPLPKSPLELPEKRKSITMNNSGDGTSSRGTAKCLGAVETNEDVLVHLGAICEYYRRREPGSPILPVLERVQGWVGASFKTMMDDLAPDSTTTGKLRLIVFPEVPKAANKEKPPEKEKTN